MQLIGQRARDGTRKALERVGSATAAALGETLIG